MKPQPDAVRGGRVYRWAPAALLVLVVTGGVAAVGMWVAGTPSVMPTAGERLTSAGRVLGLLSGYLVAVALVLMARVPVLERLLGADRLARWHAMLGRYVVCSIAAHATLITFGYAAKAHTGAASQLGTLLSDYPYVLMAAAALGLFVLVGVTSVRAARRRLAYETWYFIHLYGYLAIALAFAHQFANGAQFRGHPGNRLAWAAMYVVAAGAVVVFRVVLPLGRAWRHRLVVTGVVAESPDATSIHLGGHALERWGGTAGQFVRLRFLTRDRWWQSHPFSLSAAPDGSTIRVTVKAVGDHTRGLAFVRPGTRVFAEGPYGALTAGRRTRHKVLLIAGGIGITPLRALFQALPLGPEDMTLLYRAADEQSLVFRGELDDLVRAGQGSVVYLTGARAGDDPLSETALRVLVPDVVDRDVFLCGPPGLMAAVGASLHVLGVPRHQVHLEQFAL